jgi:ParB-like chromosome segregation protein Spo0J
MKQKISLLWFSPRNKEVYTMSDIEDLKASMAKMGLLVPIVITKDGRVISGHRRLTAAMEMGWEDIDVVVKEVAEEDEMLWIIHFNKQRQKTSQEQWKEIKVLREIYVAEQGKRTDLMDDLSGEDSKTTRQEISDATGMKESRIGRIEKIGKIAPALFDLIDAEKLSVEAAYQRCLRAEKGNIKPRNKELPKENPESITCPKCTHTWAVKLKLKQ